MKTWFSRIIIFAFPMLALASSDWQAIDSQLRLLRTIVVHEAEFSPDSRTIATANALGMVQLWDAKTGLEQYNFQADPKEVLHMAWNPDGQTIATIGSDDNLHLWNVKTGLEVQKFVGHQGFIYAIAFDATGLKLASSGLDSTVRIWDVPTGQEIKVFTGKTSVYALDFHPRNPELVMADTTVRTWNYQTNQITELTGHQNGVQSVSYNNSGTRIVSSSNDGTTRIWDLSGKELLQLKGHNHIVYQAIFSPSDTLVATRGGDQSVRLWDAKTGVQVKQFNSSGVAKRSSIDFSADKTRMVIGGYAWFTEVFGTPDFAPVF